MEERMRDVSLIRRNSYKNFVLDLYKSNYNLYENDKYGMEGIIGENLSKIDMSLISIVFPEDVDLLHVKDNEFTTSVIRTICASSDALKLTHDIDLPLNLFNEEECQKLYPIKSIDRIHTYGEAHDTESKETYDIKIRRENEYTQDVDFLMANYLPVGTRYDVSMIFITDKQPFIRLIKYLNGYKNKNFNYMERCYIALITDSNPSEELLEKLNKIMDFMDDEKMNVNKFIKEEFGIKNKRKIPELGFEENQEVENLNVEPRETIILPVKGKIVGAGRITEDIAGEELNEKEDSKLSIPDILNVEDTYKNPESYGFLINRLLKEFYSIEESEKTTITRDKLLGLIKTLHDLADRHKDYKPIEEKENDESNSSNDVVNEINEFKEFLNKEDLNLDPLIMGKLETTGLKPGKIVINKNSCLDLFKILIDKNSCLDLFNLLLTYLYSKEDILVVNISDPDINQLIWDNIYASRDKNNEYHDVEFYNINCYMNKDSVSCYARGKVKSIFIELNSDMSDKVLELIKEFMMTVIPACVAFNKYFIILADDIDNPRYKDIVKCSLVYSLTSKELKEDIIEDGLVTHLVPEDDDKMVDTIDKNDFIDISMFSPETLTYENKFKKLLSYTNIIISYDLERKILESFNSTKPLIISNSNKKVYYLLMFLFMTNSFSISSISNETPDDIVKKFMNIFNGYRNILSEKIKTDYGIVRYFMKANKNCQGISNDIECESPFEYTSFSINTFINLTTMTKKEIKKVMKSMMSRNKYTFYVILTDDISKIKTDNVILDSYFDEQKTRTNTFLSLFKK